MFPIGRLNQFLNPVVEAFLREVALLFRHPLLEPEVRLNDEFVLRHADFSSPTYRMGAAKTPHVHEAKSTETNDADYLLTDAFGLTAVLPGLNFSQSGHLPDLEVKLTHQNDPLRLICRRDVDGAPLEAITMAPRHGGARFQTVRRVTPAGVRGLVNFSSSAVSEVIIRFCSAPSAMFANVLALTRTRIVLSASLTE